MSKDDNPPGAAFSLTGQFLVAMPGMEDPRFSKSLVYLCEHSTEGAMGLIVNKPTEISMTSLFSKVELKLEIALPESARVMDGGPVATERGFVLHTADKGWKSSLRVNDSIMMTTSRDVLEAVARGDAPANWLIALGYSGWSKGQLEAELAANSWLIVPANDTLLFDVPASNRFDAAYACLGVDPALLSNIAGHA